MDDRSLVTFQFKTRIHVTSLRQQKMVLNVHRERLPTNFLDPDMSNLISSMTWGTSGDNNLFGVGPTYCHGGNY